VCYGVDGKQCMRIQTLWTLYVMQIHSLRLFDTVLTATKNFEIMFKL